MDKKNPKQREEIEKEAGCKTPALRKSKEMMGKEVSFSEWEARYRGRSKKLAIIFTVACTLAVIWLLYLYFANYRVLQCVIYTLCIWGLVIFSLIFFTRRRIRQVRNLYEKK